jgi:hypothetical protein
MSELFDEALKTVPEFIMNSPICANWVDYNGKRKFAMLNFEQSIEKGKLMIDLCYCATAGLINGRVEKTVPYSKKRFVIID